MSSNQSRASEYYQEIITHLNPASFLQDLIQKRKPESDFLEFKGASKIAERQVKEYWSQALSGFANTEGGVLVWGIRAARTKLLDDPSKTVDVATEVDLVSHPETFIQLLKDVRLEATVDAVKDVECQHYAAEGKDGAGFVVCFIPEGGHKPYRAALAADKQYYQRIGDSFAIISHSLLRSLFYPQTAPDLVLEIKAGDSTEIDSAPSPPNRKSKYSFEVRISNFGTASGQDVFIRAITNYPAEWGERECFHPAGKSYDGTFLSQRPIHPQEIDLPCFICHVTAPTILHFQARKPGILCPDRIVFDIAIYAHDTAPVKARLIFHPDEIIQKYGKTTQMEMNLNPNV